MSKNSLLWILFCGCLRFWKLSPYLVRPGGRVFRMADFQRLLNSDRGLPVGENRISKRWLRAQLKAKPAKRALKYIAMVLSMQIYLKKISRCREVEMSQKGGTYLQIFITARGSGRRRGGFGEKMASLPFDAAG